MKMRLPAATVARRSARLAALAAPAAQADPSTTVVISKIMTRGPAGGNDEVIELKNKSTAPVAIGGWQLWGSNSDAATSRARARHDHGRHRRWPRAQTYRLTNSLGGHVPAGNQTYYAPASPTTAASQLRSSAAGDVRDRRRRQRALTGPAIPFREGARQRGLVFPTVERQQRLRAARPTARRTPTTTPPTSRAASTHCDTATRRRLPECDAGRASRRSPSIQTLGVGQPAVQRPSNVKIRGIVTGIDDLYGSNFDFVFKSDAGLWVQQATRDAGATTSSAIFVAGVRRNAANPQAVIGSDITITGRIETKFGLVQLVPPGVGTTNQTAQEVNLDRRRDGQLDRQRAARRRSRSTAPRPRTRASTARTTARCRACACACSEGIATGGGTTKFRDLFLEPGTTARRLFRKNDAAAETTPWSDAPAEIGVVARRRRRQPGRSAPAVAVADADRPRPVRRHAQRRRPADVQLQLLQGHAAAARRGSQRRRAADDPARPDQRRRPADRAGPAGRTRSAWRSFNVENLFPVGKANDGHVVTAGRVRRSACTRSSRRSGTACASRTSSPSRRSRCSPTARTR